MARFPPVSSVAVDELTRLFLAARDGDRTALLQAVRASQADVWRLARHLVGPDDADDVTQDTFVRAWRALPALRGDSSARTWLLSIARRACADAVRRNVRRRRLAELVAASCGGTGAPADDPSGAHAVGALVDELPRDQRVAFVLTQVVGCSYAEAAEACGVPVGTIRSRVARGPRAARRRRCGCRRPGDRPAGAVRAVATVAAVVGGFRRSPARHPRAPTGSAASSPPTTSRVLQRVTPQRPGPHAAGRRPRHQGRAHQSRRARRRGARLRGRALPAGGAATACSRTAARRRRTSTGRPPSPASPPKSADAPAPPEWRAACRRGTTAQLARPPRALHGHRRPTGRAARPRPPARRRPLDGPDARRQRGRRRAAARSCTCHRRRRGRG